MTSRKTLPSHRKDPSYMFDIAKLSNNFFLSFHSLLFIHGSCSSTNNICHLCNKALINLHPAYIFVTRNWIFQLLNLGLSDYPKEVIGVITSQTNKFEDVVDGLGGHSRIETKFNISVVCLHP